MVVILAGGLDQNGNSLKSTDIYNPATGLFTQGCNMITPRAGHQAALVPFAPPGAAPTSSSIRFDAQTASLLLAGGEDVANGTTTPLASAEQLDRSGQFVATTPMSQSRVNFIFTAAGGEELAAGGYNSAGAPLATDDIFGAIGLPNGGFFNNPNPMTAARARQAAATFNNSQVLITGGIGAHFGLHNSAEVFDPAAAVFTPTLGPMNVARYDHTATTLVDNTVLIAGGFDITGNATNTAELYDPVSGIFTLVGNMISARADHTATLLNDGTVLIAGGYASAGDPINAAELYNPSTRTFSAVGNMTTVRAYHTATLLPDSTVLIAGGFATSAVPGNPLGSLTGFLAVVQPPLSSAEIYNPATQTFTATAGPMTAARGAHTATFY